MPGPRSKQTTQLHGVLEELELAIQRLYAVADWASCLGDAELELLALESVRKLQKAVGGRHA